MEYTEYMESGPGSAPPAVLRIRARGTINSDTSQLGPGGLFEMIQVRAFINGSQHHVTTKFQGSGFHTSLL